MNLPELAQQLLTCGYPVAYDHFKSKQETPFICYSIVEEDVLTADDTVTDEYGFVDIELYVTYKDLVAERKIKDMLKKNELPWSYDEIFIKDEGFFKCTFSIQLIN